MVLTHLRPRMAGDVTRALLDREGLAPSQVVVVVNGPGGLDDPGLEARVRMVRLPRNTGPAGGFRAGMEAAFSDPSVRWAYLCEDDIGLFSLPSPRLPGLLDRLGPDGRTGRPVGAVVAYGRKFVGRGAHTVNVVPAAGPDDAWPSVDVACWGATLVSRRVFDAGVLPDPEWFFGLEDFDFFCRVREAGFDVVLDVEAARSVASQQTSAGREEAISAARPNDADEAWRAYYHARNSIELARRHGTPSWHGWHLAYSARHIQKAKSAAARRAILHGLWDGVRGRLGEHPGYVRSTGEFGSPPDPPPEAADPAEPAR
ncbi:MAG: glycosyltransferase family 2 protein [Acidimicrobiales bacterium]